METEPVKEIIERIAQECREAGASEWDAVRIIKHLNEQNTSSREILRKRSLELLKQLNPSAAEVFDSFNRMKVRTSIQEISPFDRGNITKSLLKETSIPRSLAEKISAEVEDKIKDLKIKHLNTALIREMVDVKLLEYGLEEIHQQYARIGMPVHEVTVKMNEELFENNEILTEYNLLKIIPMNLGDLHFSHDLWINNVSDFSTKLESHSFSKIIDSGDFFESALEITTQINKLNKFFSAPCSINAANFLLYKSIQAMNQKHLKKNAGLFLKALAATESTIHLGINLFQPDFLKQKIEKEKIIEFGIMLLELSQSNAQIKPMIAIDSKFKLKLLTPEIMQKGIKAVNSEKDYFIHSNNIALSPIIASSFALNLEKLAFEYNSKETGFFEALAVLLEKTNKLKELKLKQLEKRSYLKPFNLGEAENELQAVELFNASMVFLNKKEFDRECMQFSEKIVEKMKPILGEKWIISMPEDNEASKRFNEFNQKNFSMERKSIEAIELSKNSPVKKQLNYFLKAKTKKEAEEMLESSLLVELLTSEALPSQT